MKSIRLNTGMRQMASIPCQLILFGLILIAFTFFSTSLFALGNTVCTAVAVQPGSYQANGPSTGNGARAGCGFTGATHADWYKFTPVADGTISVSSCGSFVNTRLSIFTGTAFSPAPGICNFFSSCVASDDDACFLSTSSQISGLAVTGGTTYYIQWDNKWSNSLFNWNLQFTPEVPFNDEPCVPYGASISCGEIIEGTTYGATTSGVVVSGCSSGSEKDVFYTIFPLTQGATYKIDVIAGDDMDPVLAVYKGSCVASTNLLGCSDNIGNGVDESLTFTSTDNSNYFIRVYDYLNDGGNFTISLTCLSDGCPTGIALYPYGDIIYYSNVGSTGSSNDFTCSSTPADNDVWFRFNAPTSGNFTIETHAGSISNTKIQIWDECPTTGEVIACDDDSGEGLSSKIVLECGYYLPGHIYSLQVDTYGSETGTFGISYTQDSYCPVPSNDLCVDATELLINAPPQESTNFNATGSPDILIDCEFGNFNIPDNDVWFSFTAPSSGIVTIETFAGFLHDSEMQIFDACGGNLIACDDDGGDGSMSKIILSCDSYTPGETYLVQVDGWAVKAGTFSISVTTSPCPTNDNCVDASELIIDAPPQEAANYNATGSPGISIDCGFGTENASTNDVWFSFTAPSSGVVLKIQTFAGTLTDSQLQVLDACGGNIIACDEDGGDNLMSKIYLDCNSYTPGETYLVQVDGWSGSTGTFSISVTTSICLPPPNDACANAILLDINNPGLCPANKVEGNTAFTIPSNPDACDPDAPDLYYEFNSGGNNEVIINLDAITAEDLVLSVFESSCSSTAMYCNVGTSQSSTITVNPNTTYYARVHTRLGYPTGTFNICIEKVPSENITLHGTVSGWSNNCTARNIKVSMLNLALGTLNEITTTLNPDGTFTIDGSEWLPGPYNFLFKVKGALAVLKEDVSFTAGNNFISIGPVILGDINNNNVINVLDLSIFSASFGTTSGSPGYNFLADLNCDGVINIFDVSILSAGFNKAGANLTAP